MNIGTNVTGITIPEGAAKNIKRGTEMLWQDGGLPTAFQRCEYVESHGTEWIDTQVLHSVDDIMYVFKFRALYTEQASRWRSIIGNNRSAEILFNDNDTLAILFGNTQGSATASGGVPRSSTDIYEGTVRFTNNAVSFSVNGITGIESCAPAKVDSAKLFVFGYSSASRTKNIKMYHLEIFLSGNIVRNFIPCYLKTAWNGIPAGTIGLYDLCGSLSSNGTPFYTNGGTGAFTKGPDVL